MPNAAPLDSAQLTARIPQTLWRAARLAAHAADVPFTTWVREAVAEHLAECQRGRGPRRKGAGRPKVTFLSPAAREP